jgi:multicomponent Na+:H+ antiporter subunit D
MIVALLAVCLPIVAGLGLLLLRIEDRRRREWYVMGSLLIGAVCSLSAFWLTDDGVWTLISFSQRVTFALCADSLGRVFGTMATILWIPATVYAFEYMKHEGAEPRFFAFYLMSFGVTMGIALSANPVTLFFFYECLTLATLPLVMHAMDGRARYAGKLYVAFSMGGAGIAFAAVIFLIVYSTGDMTFSMGGILDPELIAASAGLVQMMFLFAFFGFGVKAAVWPLHNWLPAASVAPTPVTALLHAVAVVKAGVFAVIRMIYYAFGAEVLAGTDAQTFVLLIAAFTIVFGSARALRASHFKRRLAYSTVSNLSYMLLGACLMTPAGLAAALLHMIVHAVSKITLFFCAGAVYYRTGREYVYELQGLGRRMPVVMVCFSLTGLCLMGIPPLAGFASKWSLATAAVAVGTVPALLGVVALIVSAVLTALYIIPVIITAFRPDPNGRTERLDPNRYMTVPLCLFTLGMLVISLVTGPLLAWFMAL